MPRLRLSTLTTICREAIRHGISMPSDNELDPGCSFRELTAAAYSPSGNVAIAGAGLPVQYFDANGRWLRELGTIGYGPGQYAGVNAIRFDREGSVRLLDLTNFRTVTIDTSDRREAGTQLEPPPQFADVGLGPGGAVFFTLPPGKTIGDPVQAKLIHVDALGHVSGTPTEVTAPAAVVSGVDLQPAKPFFLAKPVWDIGPAQSVTYSTGEGPTIECYDSSGKARLQIRVAMPLLQVNAADIANETARELAGFSTPAWRERAKRFIKRAADTAPKTHAAFTRLIVMDDGDIWVRESARTGSDSARWDNFRADGRPFGFTMLASSDAILGGTAHRLLLEEGGNSADKYILTASVSSPAPGANPR